MKLQKSSCALPHCVMQTRIAHELLVRVIMLGTPQMVWQKIPTNSETNRPNKTLFKRLAQKSCSMPTQVTPASTPSCESASCTSHETPDPGVGQNFRRLTIELSPQMFRLQQKIQNRNITP